ncbi:hypothetical protein L484_018789 [Morus notabilis]|uniref:Protein NIM1-INTERACTING 1 n=1 Tax=Morus notabilis TaxID=981085 RepID=W9R4C3_9ROSA|nr:hypothetical protein L484_018789 [Morus notabilis]
MADNINEISKKRKKVINDDNDEELATEEQQIDKFYALIRSMREARDRLIMINQSNQAENKDRDLKHVHNINTDIKRRKAEELEKEPPSFQRGDFINTNNIPEVLFKVPKAVTFVNSSSSSSSSSNSHVIGAVRSDEKEDRQISTKDDLDLTLSL